MTHSRTEFAAYWLWHSQSKKLEAFYMQNMHSRIYFLVKLRLGFSKNKDRYPIIEPKTKIWY